jgi:excisionase family DNA binding protein
MDAKILVISTTDLKELLSNVVREAIDKKVLTEPKEEPLSKEEKLFNRKETARKLRISLPTLGVYVKKGVITGHKIGARILFKESDIQTALTKINQKYS